MSYSSEDWRKAITNLIKKTSRKEVSWNLTDMYEADAGTEVVRSFKATLGDKIYVVSETRTKQFYNEEDFYWSSGYAFSVFGKLRIYDGRLASAPSDLSAISSLFAVAEASFAFESDVLGGLLD